VKDEEKDQNEQQILGEIMRRGLRQVGSRTGHETLLSVNHRLNNALMILNDERRGQDPHSLNEIIKTVEPIRRWMRERNFFDGENDALWGLSLCYRRTERHIEAANCLVDLRDNIASARESIEDPTERAQIMARFPQLFPSLCRVYDKLNQTPDVLLAIEESKGRILADLQAKLRKERPSDKRFREAVDQLPSLITRARVHYLTYLVGEDATFAVLLASDGSLHRNVAPLTQKDLSSFVKTRDPRSWGKGNPSNPLSKQIRSDQSTALSPLVAWLEPLVADGILSRGDHICYSPDSEIHCLPLHYVNFLGEAMVRQFSLSRIHGAHSLVELLSENQQTPMKFVSVEVPAKQDAPDKREHLRQPVESLNEILSGAGVRYPKIGLDDIREVDFTGSIVHFATHGVFVERPEDNRGFNPFQSSGLLLASEGSEPDLFKVVNGRSQDLHLLSPQKLLEMDIGFSGSHVTFQACVTGLAREGVGGEALGLEWALFQKGAQSLLSTHWNVDSETSSLFTKRFYEEWLLHSKSRAEAWWTVVLEFMQSDDALSNPYHWAPYSLSGDWR